MNGINAKQISQEAQSAASIEALARSLQESLPGDAVIITFHSGEVPHNLEIFVEDVEENYWETEQLPHTRTYLLLGLDLPSELEPGIDVLQM